MATVQSWPKIIDGEKIASVMTGDYEQVKFTKHCCFLVFLSQFITIKSAEFSSMSILWP